MTLSAIDALHAAASKGQWPGVSDEWKCQSFNAFPAISRALHAARSVAKECDTVSGDTEMQELRDALAALETMP